MQNQITALLMDAALLLLVGMTVVFTFLSIMIVVIHLIRLLDNKLPKPELSLGRASTQPTSQSNVSPAIVAAISAAVHQHRQKN